MDNPYAPPSAPLLPPPLPDSEAEAIRKEHLKHEASIQGVGTLFFAGGVIGILVFALPFIAVLTSMGEEDSATGIPEMLMMLFFVTLSIGQIFIGRGLRKLAPWARGPAIGVSCIGLLGFPIGTLLSAYFIYLLVSAKGQLILSERYRQIREATPHIRYKTPLWLWILLGLLVLAIGLLIALASLG